MEVVRGNHAKFKAAFVDVDGNPLVPSDPEAYPSVLIKDPTGETYSTGVGRALDTHGNYQFEWFAPEDLDLTPIDQNWSVSWYFTNADFYTRSVEDTFRVVDSIIPSVADTQLVYLTRDGLSERLVLSLEKEALSVEVQVRFGATSPFDGATEVASTPEETSATMPSGTRKIGKVVNNGLVTYYFNTRPLTTGTYVVFWDTIADATAQRISHQQEIVCPPAQYWLWNKSLLTFIDKIRKKYSTFQAYTEDQLYECMIRGVGIVNAIQPATAWTLGTIPLTEAYGIGQAVLLGAAKWAFMIQSVLEEELKFGHTGQTVGLDVSHEYTGVVGMIDSLLTQFAEAKPRIVRMSSRPGITGVRPLHYGGYSSRIYKTGSSSSNADSFAGFGVLLSSMNL